MARINIAGRLHSVESGNIVTGANEVYDDSLTLRQDAINAQTQASLSEIRTQAAEMEDRIEEVARTKEMSLGVFPSSSALTAKYPAPEVGNWALVGTSNPFQVYECQNEGTWTNTGGTWDGGEIDLTDYVTEEEFDVLAADVAGGCARISATGVGQGPTSSSDTVTARFYGVIAGHTYRLHIQKPSIDYTGISYSSAGYLRFSVSVRDNTDTSLLSVITLNFDTRTAVAPFYDIVIPSTMTTADNIRIAFRAAEGFVEWFQLEDITDHAYLPNISLVGRGNDIVYSAFYKGLKGGRKYRILIKSPNIDMSGVTNTNSRLIIYMVDLSDIVVDTTTQVVRWNKADDLPNYYDIEVPDDGVDYALHYCMRASAGAEQILEVIDMTDFGQGGGGDEPFAVTLQMPSSALANTGWVGEFGGGKTYRVMLSDPDIDISGNSYKDRPTFELFIIQYAPYVDGEVDVESRQSPVVRYMTDWPLDSYYDIQLPDTADSYALRIYQRATPGLSMTYTISEIKQEDEDSNAGSGGTSMLSLIQGNIGQNGKVLPADDYVHTSPIAGGRGFYILLNEGYEIFDIHLFKSDGTIAGYSYFPLGLDRPPSSVYKRESGLRCYYSNLSMPQGYYMVLVITKVTTSGGTRSDISTTDNAIEEFTYMDNPHLHPLPWTPNPWVGTQAQYDALTSAQKATLDCIVVDGNITIPYIPSDKARMLKDRYKSITNAVWTPKAKVPVAGATYSNHWDDYLFLEGQTRIGVCYSEVAQFSKYVGQHVSLYTFLTAAKNKRSVLYTENIKTRTSKYGYTYCDSTGLATLIAPFYGTVCSGLTGYVLCMKNIKVAATYHPTRSDKVPNLTLVPNGDSTNVLPMDIIAYSTHVSVVTDVYLDDDGKRKFIVWTEMTRPFAISSPMTCEQFDKRLADKRASEDVYILRPDSYDDITAPMADPVQKDFMQMPQEINDCAEICTHLGDKPCVGMLDILYLNCYRGDKYTSCIIERSTDNGETWSTVSTVNLSSLSADTLYPEDDEDWVRVDLCSSKAWGKYRAHLTGSSDTSGYTNWEVLDNTADYYGGVITFANEHGTPYLIREEKSKQGYMLNGNHVRELTDSEIEEGSITVDWTYVESSGTVIKVFFQGDYGVAVKEISYLN